MVISDLERPAVEPAPPEAGGWMRRLSPFVAVHRRNVFIALGVSIAGQAVAALTPIVEKIIVDDVIVSHQRPLAPWLALLIAGRSCSAFAAAYVRRYVGGRVSLDVQFDLRNAVYERLQRLDFASHDQLQTGQLVVAGLERRRPAAGRACRSCRSCSATSCCSSWRWA